MYKKTEEIRKEIKVYEDTLDDIIIEISSMSWYNSLMADDLYEMMEITQKKIDDLYIALRVPKECMGS